MNGVQWPAGLRVERLSKVHDRGGFASGQPEVDNWLRTKALQNQDKHLSSTKVLLDSKDAIAGYYTLATGEVDFGDLPANLAKKLPRRRLPVAILAWLGVSQQRHRQGIGTRLLAQALRDCWEADRAFGIVAVILDCLDESAKAFYQQFDFEEFPGYPMRLFLSAAKLNAMISK